MRLRVYWLTCVYIYFSFLPTPIILYRFSILIRRLIYVFPIDTSIPIRDNCFHTQFERRLIFERIPVIIKSTIQTTFDDKNQTE